ncbi:hypothetical protein, partial [Veillonella sp.]|uniref:hypothetical protein n=4 Tax=Veillonella TaxID=29465 RepID=UPI0025F48B6C
YLVGFNVVETRTLAMFISLKMITLHCSVFKDLLYRFTLGACDSLISISQSVYRVKHFFKISFKKFCCENRKNIHHFFKITRFQLLEGGHLMSRD